MAQMIGTISLLLFVVCTGVVQGRYTLRKHRQQLYAPDTNVTGSTHRTPWIQTLSKYPRAYLYHNFITPEECDHLITLAAPLMKRSLVESEDEGHQVDNVRTSYGMFLPRRLDSTMISISDRLALWSHLPPINHEAMQILRYEKGQQYVAHCDGLGRAATVLIYLNDVEEGGETAFPYSQWIDPAMGHKMSNVSQCAKGHVAARARRGDALLFFSKHPDGHSIDDHAEHTGCPVIKGIKWTATVWMHPNAYEPETYETEKDETPQQDPGLCQDYHSQCEFWATKGECKSNTDYMIGTNDGLGQCRKACKKCTPCTESDTECYKQNRESAGYLTLDDELMSLIGMNTHDVMQNYQILTGGKLKESWKEEEEDDESEE